MTNISLNSSQVIKQLGLIEKGRSDVVVTFDKSFYNEGDIASMKVLVDNTKCDKDNTEILVQLVRVIDYLSMPGKVSQIRDVVAERRFDGAAANTALETTLSLELRDTLQTDKQIVKQNDWNYMLLEPEDLFLQEHLLPTVRGNLIKSVYFFEVSFKHAGLTFGSSIPNILFPVYMFVPELKENLHLIEKPLDYHPKEFERINIKPMVSVFEAEYTKLLYMPLSLKDAVKRYETVKEGDKLKMEATI